MRRLKLMLELCPCFLIIEQTPAQFINLPVIVLPFNSSIQIIKLVQFIPFKQFFISLTLQLHL